jgi:hypothetical protein
MIPHGLCRGDLKINPEGAHHRQPPSERPSTSEAAPKRTLGTLHDPQVAGNTSHQTKTNVYSDGSQIRVLDNREVLTGWQIKDVMAAAIFGNTTRRMPMGDICLGLIDFEESAC